MSARREPPQTWSNLGPFPPLTLEALQAAYQRLVTCELCGWRVELDQRARTVGDRLIHAQCEREDVLP